MPNIVPSPPSSYELVSYLVRLAVGRVQNLCCFTHWLCLLQNHQDDATKYKSDDWICYVRKYSTLAMCTKTRRATPLLVLNGTTGPSFPSPSWGPWPGLLVLCTKKYLPESTMVCQLLFSSLDMSISSWMEAGERWDGAANGELHEPCWGNTTKRIVSFWTRDCRYSISRCARWLLQWWLLQRRETDLGKRRKT